MPTDLNNIAIYAIAFIFVIALILIGARLLRGGLSKSGNTKPGSFLRGRDRRLGVVEAASVDGRRKLILLRRDDVEHLIMTGGPVDVVVETGIQSPQSEEPSFEPQKREEREERDDGRVTIARDHEPAAPEYEQDS